MNFIFHFQNFFQIFKLRVTKRCIYTWHFIIVPNVIKIKNMRNVFFETLAKDVALIKSLLRFKIMIPPHL